MHTLLLIVHGLIAASLVGVVLIQRGKGAEAGAAFGSGASNTVFGSRGSASFLTRATAVLATLFFITSLSLAFSGSEKQEFKSVTELAAPPAPTAPAVHTAPAETPSAGAGVPKKPMDVPVMPGK